MFMEVSTPGDRHDIDLDVRANLSSVLYAFLLIMVVEEAELTKMRPA